MAEEIIIPLIVFATMFGIFYLFISSRHKERMALIEKGQKAELFNRNDGKPFWRSLVLILACLSTGIGIGIFIGYLLHSSLGVEEDVAYSATVFLMAGLGLLTGYRLSDGKKV